jgi:hypothetical protein
MVIRKKDSKGRMQYWILVKNNMSNADPSGVGTANEYCVLNLIRR